MTFSEEDRRIYYQDIVYQVCSILDYYYVEKTCCGTVEEPSIEVQEKLRELLRSYVK